MDISSLKEQLRTKKKIVILVHKNPDGDALGSSFALGRYLQENHDVCVVFPNRFPVNLNWLVNNDNYLIYEDNKPEAKQIIQESEIVFCLDFNTLSRMGEELEHIVNKHNAFKVLVDHHPDPEKFADICISETIVSSTCELLYTVLVNLSGSKNFSVGVLECIYLGIMTDTGNFSYNSSRPETFVIVSELLKQGVDKDRITKQIFSNDKLNRLKLLGYCLNNKLVVLEEYNTALFSLSLDEKEMLNFENGDTEGFVNIPLTVKGIEFSAFFTEHEEGVRISFRSKYHFDTNKFSRKYFNGGGHINASGGFSKENLEDTIKRFIEIMKEVKVK